MPPIRKSLTPSERKLKKKKHDIINKATIKKEYHKVLSRHDPTSSTPDYVKEIFDEPTTISKDGKATTAYQNKTIQKPNPYKAQLEARQREKQSKEQERLAREQNAQQGDIARKRYYGDRSKQRSKMMARNKRGQPKLSVQMGVLLDKISKEAGQR